MVPLLHSIKRYRLFAIWLFYPLPAVQRLLSEAYTRLMNNLRNSIRGMQRISTIFTTDLWGACCHNTQKKVFNLQPERITALITLLLTFDGRNPRMQLPFTFEEMADFQRLKVNADTGAFLEIRIFLLLF